MIYICLFLVLADIGHMANALFVCWFYAHSDMGLTIFQVPFSKKSSKFK